MLSELWIVLFFDTKTIGLSHLVTRMAGCINFYTRAYFSFSVVEMIVFSLSYYSLLYLTEGYLFALLVIVSMILSRWAFKGSWPLGFDRPTTYDSSVDRYVEAMIVFLVDYFFLDLPVDRSFETTTDSSNRVSRVRGIRIIMMLCQASWFSQMGCETLFYSWFDHSNSSAEHLLRPMESFSDHFSGLRVVATCHIGTYFPSSFLHSLAFKATISSRLWHSKPLFLFFSLAFKAIG